MNGKSAFTMQAYLKPPLQYSEPISRIRVIKLSNNRDEETNRPDSSVDAFNDFVLSEGKEFIIINLSEYFPFQELLNRCINLEIHPLSLSSVFNVLYCIHAWLQNDTHNVFLHNSGSLCECELILACYFLWTTLQSSTPLSEISYQDILMDIVRMDNPTASIDQVPHSVVNVIRNFYSLLLDESSSLPYGRSLVFKNCQILGLFLKNHASFSKPPIIIIGTGHRVFFSSRSDIDSVIWNRDIGELIIVCSVPIHGDFYISCFADDSEVGSSVPLFFYSYNTLFLNSDINEVTASDLDCSPQIDDKTLTITLLSAAMEEEDNSPPFLKPSDCFQTGLRTLVRNHSLQLSPASKQLLAEEEENRQLLLHFGLLLFDGDVEKARVFVGEEVKEEKKEEEEEVKEEVKEVNKEENKEEGNARVNEEQEPEQNKKETPSLPSKEPNSELEATATPLPTSTPILGAPHLETLPKSFAKTTATPKGRKGVLLRFHPRVRDFF
ncbi:hypothetical protein BLSTO_01049, partial [Blastocystis sp. subtype 1]